MFQINNVSEFDRKVRGIALFLRYNKQTKRDDIYLAYNSKEDEKGHVGFYRITSNTIGVNQK